MSRNKSDRPKNHPTPDKNQDSGEKHLADCNVYVRGGVEIDLAQRLNARHEAEQIERTTHDNKQLFWTRLTFWGLITYTTITGLMYWANKKAADAAKSAADTAGKGLLVSERPWVSAGDIRIKEPLTFDARGGLMTIAYTLRNTGRSPALHANWRSKLIILPKKRDAVYEFSEPLQALCEPMRKMPSDLWDTTIFTGDVIPGSEGLALYPNEVDAALKARESGLFARKGYISMAVIACVDYQVSFSPEHHQTRYGFMVVDAHQGGGLSMDIEPKDTHPNLRLTYFSQTAD